MVARLSTEAVMSKKTSSSAPSALYNAASSTGSPASRKLTKLTPLTRRPSVTSRQGMIRLVSMALPFKCLNGRRQVNSAAVERLAHDCSLDAQRGDCAQVIYGADAARCNQCAVGRCAADGCLHCLQGGQVWPLQCAIARDVGINDVLRAARAEFASQRGRLDVRRLAPSGDGYAT